ncbi:MAG: hypothetical protein ACI8QD_002637 [Cyclobacteriaceae bacterium]|jgi:hypothetical protein
MKNLKFIVTVLLAVSLVFFSSCDALEDEIEIDYFEESEGMYSYTMTQTLLANPTIHNTETGTLKVNNLAGDIWFQIDPETDNQGVFTYDVTPAGNGYVFNMLTFTAADFEGDYYDCKGIECASLEGVNYHGMYDSENREITCSMKVDYTLDIYDGYNYTIEMVATKIQD